MNRRRRPGILDLLLAPRPVAQPAREMDYGAVVDAALAGEVPASLTAEEAEFVHDYGPALRVLAESQEVDG